MRNNKHYRITQGEITKGYDIKKRLYDLFGERTKDRLHVWQRINAFH